jgi:hypothetical protein
MLIKLTGLYVISLDFCVCFRLELPECVSEFPLCITHMCWPKKNTLVLSVHGLAGVFLATVQIPQSSSNDKLPLG